MQNNGQKDALIESEKQLEGLFIYFGKFLYENISSGNLSAKTHTGSEHFDKQLKGIAPEIKTTTEILNFRGSIKPYTSIMVKLYEAKKTILALSEDVESFISMAAIHMGSDSYLTDSLVTRFREREKELLFLIGNNMEVIKDIMKSKQDGIKDKKDPSLLSSDEKKFLKKSEKDISRITNDVSSLIKETKMLFRSIKESYDKDLETSRKETAARFERTLEPLTEPVAVEPVIEAETVEELPEKQEEVEEIEEVFAEEIDEEIEKELAEIKGIPEEEDEDETEDEAEDETEDDEEYETEQTATKGQGLMEAARRRLYRIDISESDKFDVINTVYNNLPDTAPDFIVETIVEADMPIKKQLLEVLKHIDGSKVVELYRKMVLSSAPFLRIHGIIGLSRLNVENARNVIISAVDDPNSTVRRLVANFLECSDSISEMTALIKLSSDPDDTVARVAIRKMGRAKLNRVAFINLIPKLLHNDVRIRKEAIVALREITGTDLGYNFSATEEKRRAAVSRWEELWNNNESNPNFIRDLRKIIKDHRKKTK